LRRKLRQVGEATLGRQAIQRVATGSKGNFSRCPKVSNDSDRNQ